MEDFVRLPIGKSGAEGAYLSLWSHCADTAYVMLRLYQEWLPKHVRKQMEGGLSSEKTLKTLRFLALTHDIGKITPVFQHKITVQLRAHAEALEQAGLLLGDDDKALPHAQAGEAILIVQGCPIRLAAVVGAHHGAPSKDDPDLEEAAKHKVRMAIGDSRFTNRKAWTVCREQFLNRALAEAGYASVDELPLISFRQQVLMTALLIMADWIASNADYFSLCGDAEGNPDRREEGWKQFCVPDRWQPESESLSPEQFHLIFGFAPNEVQRAVLHAAESVSEPGLMILEAPMGIGKTEAAFAAAEVLASRFKSGGLYIGLPTQATASGIFPRLLQWTEKQAGDGMLTIKLAHAMAELVPEYASVRTSHVAQEGAFVHEWFAGRKRALLSDFVAGTVDQLLMASLKQKHMMLRHLGLAAKVVVVDECHAYDAYMNVYLDRTLMWLAAYHVPVLLLSATLPAARREAMVRAYLRGLGATDPPKLPFHDAYPLLTWTDGERAEQRAIPLSTERRDVRISQITEDELIRTAAEKADAGAAVGIICNTVGRAQSLLEALRQLEPNREIMLCHAQFLAEDRAEWENELIRRIGKTSVPETRRGLIVIGTQVLEQSLDIDFDWLATDLCPMDLLLQRIGRLHRHRRERPAVAEDVVCGVVLSSDGWDAGTEKIYGAWLLERTLRELPEALTLPDDISPLVQTVYAEPTDREQPAYQEYCKRRDQQRNHAEMFCIRSPEDTAFDEWLFTAPLIGLLDADVGSGDEETACAAVRDSVSSIEVILLIRSAGGTVTFLPWREAGRRIPTGEMPDWETAQRMARQRVKLPHRLAAPWIAPATVAAIQGEHPVPPPWRESPWLKHALFLFLNERLETTLCGYTLRYSREAGLMIKEDEHGTGI